ncbi:hypothetical protein ACH4U7_49265 [Streptomyces sp. NPDC020845]|uniref:hypothetical protein n=1 Tax=Streptomyces sp. NPDC020845 TaxID=3365096 RepID=UPI00378C1BCF
MTDIDTIVAYTRKAGLGVRVVSAPPFAFPVHAPSEADDAVSNTDGTLVGLGLVRLDEAARRELTRLAGAEGVAGIAVPPVARGRSYDGGVLREVLGVAAEPGLSVLMHPMQLPRPEWDHHYLGNLIGNPDGDDDRRGLGPPGRRSGGPARSADLLRTRRRLRTVPDREMEPWVAVP